MMIQLNKRRQHGNLRRLGTVESLVDFASNDYLGLARSKSLQQSVLREWNEIRCMQGLNGLGSTGSRLLTGNSLYAERLEENIANYHGYESGLLFNCGYMANLGLLSSAAQSGDLIFYDTHIHASMHDGIRLSRGSAFPFKHNDVEHLRTRLERVSGTKKRFVCVESIYSTDGSFAPLEAICRLCQEHDINLIVDEAHATGIFGKKGAGLVAEKQLAEYVFAQITTFGKALGTHGAIVLGTRVLKEYLVNFARSCVYTTAMPLHTLAAVKCSYDMLPYLERERTHLKKLMLQFENRSPIQCIHIPGNREVRKESERLAEKGFDVRALMSPTVKRGEECLRICLHAFNTEEELRQLLEHIEVAKKI